MFLAQQRKMPEFFVYQLFFEMIIIVIIIIIIIIRKIDVLIDPKWIS